MTIVITTDTLASEGMDLLERSGRRIVTMPLSTPPEELAAIIARENPEGIISRSLRLDARIIGSAPRLKAISKYGVGFDNIDIAAATARGIPVFITRSANSQSVAELTIGLMIAVARQIPQFDNQLKDGRWERTLSQGIELHGSVLGIVGYGTIGRLVAPIARAIGMQVHVFDPLLEPGAVVAPFVMQKNLHDLLRAADVTSLHCPLDETTRGMIGRTEFTLMKPSSILLNTARGAVVDEDELIAALQARKIAGAGLDTFAREPLDTASQLRRLKNVVLTPHCGAGTAASARRVSLNVVENLLAALDGDYPLANLVNREILPSWGCTQQVGGASAQSSGGSSSRGP